jgi:hypothetical protein
LLKQQGSTKAVVMAYSSCQDITNTGIFDPHQVKGDGQVELVSYQVMNQDGKPFPLPVTNEDILVAVRMRIKVPIRQPAAGISVSTLSGILMTSINTVELGSPLEPFQAGEVILKIRLAQVTFLPGSYNANFWVMTPQGHIFANAESVIRFEIGQTPLYGTSQLDSRWGCVYTHVEFNLIKAENIQ